MVSYLFATDLQRDQVLLLQCAECGVFPGPGMDG